MQLTDNSYMNNINSFISGNFDYNNPMTEAHPLVDATSKEFPALASLLNNVAFKQSKSTDSRMLEFYPPGEEYSFDPSRPAIEVFGDKASPTDIAADLVSHHLAKGEDQTVTDIYNKFEKSLTPEQLQRLRDQYSWAKMNAGETRSYNDWYKAEGLPAYFRGYAFGQWPDSEKLYTKDQLKDFDNLISYLKTPQLK